MNITADILLLKGLQNGNTKSFEALFVKYYPRFYNFILRFVKNEFTAEDMAQNIFTRLWLNRENIDLNLSLTTYLYTLSKYEIYNYYRSKHNRLTLPISEPLHENTPEEHTFEEQLYADETYSIIRKEIEAMPQRRREVFCMSRYEYLSAKEIAQRTGLSTRTVEKHIELALRQLREALRHK